MDTDLSDQKTNRAYVFVFVFLGLPSAVILGFFAFGFLLMSLSRDGIATTVSANMHWTVVPSSMGLIAILLFLFFSARYLSLGPRAIAGRSGALVVVALVALVPLAFTVPAGLFFTLDGADLGRQVTAIYFSGLPILIAQIFLIVLSVRASTAARRQPPAEPGCQGCPSS